MKSQTPHFAELLRSYGSKATKGRIELLEILWKEREPITVGELKKKLGRTFNEVTIYRALESLAEAGLIREVDFRHGHAHYEMNVLREHHHHIVCKGCGGVEDLSGCVIEPLALSKQSKFKTISDHSLEIYGLCKSCA